MKKYFLPKFTLKYKIYFKGLLISEQGTEQIVGWEWVRDTSENISSFCSLP